MGSDVDIEANEQNIQSVLSEKNQFYIPDYQRPYSWKEEHWSDLWNDLDSIDIDDTHFLGSVVVIKNEKPVGKLNQLEIIDGQQRLTTISLCLCAIRDEYEKIGDPNDIIDLIEKEQLYVRDNSGDSHDKLILSRLDKEDYEKILDGRLSAVDDDSKILEAYNFFRDKIDDFDKNALDQIRTKLVSSLTIVLVECEDESSAFRLFETLNDRGLELSAIDLMKNSLLKVTASRYGSTSREYRHVKNQWEYLLDEVVREISHPDRFFRHYMMAHSIVEKNDNISKNKLYDEFRDVLNNELPTNGIDIEEYIDQMVEISDLYLGITQSSVDVFKGRPQKKINSRLQNLNDLKSSHTRTLILRSFEEFDESSEILEVLSILEDFATRITVMEITTGAKQDKIFSKLCSDAFDEANPIEEIRSKLKEEAPSDEEFMAKFASRSYKMNDLTKYLLESIERDHYVSGSSGKTRDRSNVDIEHIAPRSALRASKYDTWKDKFDINNAKYKSDYRDRIGNLTLLEDKLNKSASTNPFQEKKDKYRSSEFEMTQAISEEYDDWGTGQIENRSDKLAEYAVDVWDFN